MKELCNKLVIETIAQNHVQVSLHGFHAAVSSPTECESSQIEGQCLLQAGN
jgi:hypothetical protein